jgi:WD40 repeat protein
VYDLLTGEKIQTFDHLINFPSAVYHQNTYGESSVLSVAFSEDGSLLAAAYEDATISIWDVTSGEEYSLPSSFEFVGALAFSPDSEFLAISSGWDGKLSLYRISDFENITLELVQNSVGFLVEEPFSPDMGYLLTMESFFSAAPKYALFDLETMELIRRAAAPGILPRFSQDGFALIFRSVNFD